MTAAQVTDFEGRNKNYSSQAPNTCLICGKSFTSRNKLFHHLRVDHAVDNCRCTKCHLKFGCRRELFEHLKTNHIPQKRDIVQEIDTAVNNMKMEELQELLSSPDCPTEHESVQLARDVIQALSRGVQTETERKKSPGKGDMKSTTPRTDGPLYFDLRLPDGKRVRAMLDSGAARNFIHPKLTSHAQK